MWKQGKPVSKKQIVKAFTTSEKSIESTLSRLRDRAMIQPTGSKICQLTNNPCPHYMLTAKAMDRIFNRKNTRKAGNFFITTDKNGWEYLTASPTHTYIDNHYPIPIKVYPSGFAIGVRG